VCMTLLLNVVAASLYGLKSMDSLNNHLCSLFNTPSTISFLHGFETRIVDLSTEIVNARCL
jgi:hypothetical protein